MTMTTTARTTGTTVARAREAPGLHRTRPLVFALTLVTGACAGPDAEEAAPPEVSTTAQASCASDPAAGTWINQRCGSPYKIDVYQPCPIYNGKYYVTVWERQAGGSLYKRGTFEAIYHDYPSGRWLEPQPYGVGGYLQHLSMQGWGHWSTSQGLRVWVRNQSLDAKPDWIRWEDFIPDTGLPVQCPGVKAVLPWRGVSGEVIGQWRQGRDP